MLVNLHTAVLGKRRPVPLAALAGSGERAATVDGAITGRRAVWFDPGGRIDTPVYRR